MKRGLVEEVLVRFLIALERYLKSVDVESSAPGTMRCTGLQTSGHLLTPTYGAIVRCLSKNYCYILGSSFAIFPSWVMRMYSMSLRKRSEPLKLIVLLLSSVHGFAAEGVGG